MTDQYLMRKGLGTPLSVWVDALRGKVDSLVLGAYDQAYTRKLRIRYNGSSSKLKTEAADAINDYVRLKMREEGFMRRIAPPATLSSNKPVKSIPFASPTARKINDNIVDQLGGNAGWWHFSALGVLCDLYLRVERQQTKGQARWQGDEFRWKVKGKLRRSSSCKKIPAPVRAWWERHHPTLPFQNLKPFIRDVQMEFKQFADLLDMHVPWAT